MKTEVKDKPLIKGAQLVENPELIRVQTISPKIVDQLEYLDDNRNADSAQGLQIVVERMQNDVEIVGSLGRGYEVVVRLADGQIKRIRALAYKMYLMEIGLSNDEANMQYAALPQLFTA